VAFRGQAMGKPIAAAYKAAAAAGDPKSKTRDQRAHLKQQAVPHGHGHGHGLPDHRKQLASSAFFSIARQARGVSIHPRHKRVWLRKYAAAPAQYQIPDTRSPKVD
jgi:hypothetical protein